MDKVYICLFLCQHLGIPEVWECVAHKDVHLSTPILVSGCLGSVVHKMCMFLIPCQHLSIQDVWEGAVHRNVQEVWCTICIYAYSQISIWVSRKHGKVQRTNMCTCQWCGNVKIFQSTHMSIRYAMCRSMRMLVCSYSGRMGMQVYACNAICALFLFQFFTPECVAHVCGLRKASTTCFFQLLATLTMIHILHKDA